MGLLDKIIAKQMKKKYGWAIEKGYLSDEDFDRCAREGVQEAFGSRNSSSSSSSRSSVKKCCANCRYFEIGDVWGHHGAYIGGGGCCCKSGERRLMFSVDEMHYDELHKKKYCDSFSK